MFVRSFLFLSNLVELLRVFSNLEKTHLGYVYFTSNLVRPS